MVILTPRGGGNSSSMATLSRLSAAILLGLLGATNAQALPDPLLGPEGAFWAGTLHPESPNPLQANRDWVVVDPVNGDLIVESTDFRLKDGAPLNVRRTYQNGSWQFSFEDKSKDSPQSSLNFQREGDRISSIRDQNGRSLTLSYDGNSKVSLIRSDTGRECYYDNQGGKKLVAASCNDGTRVRYLYEPAGTLRGLIWSDGSLLRVHRNTEGKVDQMVGPGNRTQSYNWKKNGLIIQEANGLSSRVLFSTDGYTVRDPGGQTVTVKTKDGRIQSWQDPSGVETRILREKNGLISAVEIGGTGQWRLTWNKGSLTRIEDPLGAAWSYARNESGALIGLQEPDGVKRRFSRDLRGLIRSIETANGSLRLSRNANGQIIQIQRASGAETKLIRNPKGQITSMIDPAGGALILKRNQAGEVSSISERTGETWAIQHDALGRSKSLTTPSGGILKWSRSSQGRISRLEMSKDRSLSYATNTAGLPTRIVSSNNASRGLEWNGSRQIRRIHLEDGSILQLGRSAKGALTSVDFNGLQLKIKRNPLGFPESVGPLQFTWTGNGWHSIQAPGFDITLERGFGGNIRGLNYGEESLKIVRDSAGRVIRIQQQDQPMFFKRDANGLVTSIRSDQGEWTFRRDVRSLVNQSHKGTNDQRRLYDAAGRLLKVFSTDNPGLAAQYDNEGRLSLLRFPQGNLTRFGYGPATRFLMFEDANGKTLLSSQVDSDAHGRAKERKEGDRRIQIHRDPRGQVVSRADNNSAWSWMPDVVEGPDEYLLELDDNKRPRTLRLPISTQAWAGQPTRANYILSEGQIQTLELNEAKIDFQLDALGRPTSVETSDGRWWRIYWDGLGRLKEIRNEEGVEELHFDLEQWVSQTQNQIETDYLRLSKWGRARLGENPASWMLDDQGNTRLLHTRNHDQIVNWTPIGLPSTQVGPLRSRDRWAALEGSLVLDSEGATEALSGHRLQYQWTPAWRSGHTESKGWTQVDGSQTSWWAPDPWMEKQIFSEPLRVLMDLGELEPNLDESWTLFQDPTPPLPWLPPSAATHNPPLGPPRNTLPLELSPLETLCLKAVLGPVFPLNSQSIGLALLQPEFDDLPSLNWLGEGGWTWWLMGAERWLELP
jgi:YD repeat-containing protein